MNNPENSVLNVNFNTRQLYAGSKNVSHLQIPELELLSSSYKST